MSVEFLEALRDYLDAHADHCSTDGETSARALEAAEARANRLLAAYVDTRIEAALAAVPEFRLAQRLQRLEEWQSAEWERGKGSDL